MLPEVLDVVVRNMKHDMAENDDESENKTRRLEEAETGPVFDEIAVEFSDLTYKIDKPLIAKLIHNKAFDLVDDGRKRELGQIKFIGFDLESRIQTSPKIVAESADTPEHLSHSAMALLPPLLALLSLTSLALVAGALVLVRGRSRRSEGSQENLELEETHAKLSRDVTSQGYEPVSLEA